MQEKTEHTLSYKMAKDLGSYIVWENKLSSLWRFILGLPLFLLAIPLIISPLYTIYKEEDIPSLFILILFILGILLVLLGLAVMGSWKSLVLDGVMGTLTFYKYFLWRPSAKVYHFSGIEGLEIRKTEIQFSEESAPQEYYEIHLLYGGKRIPLDGSSNKEEAEEFARRIAQIVGREVKWG